MRKNYQLIISLLVVSTLAACASLSPEECKIADWKKIGFNDAMQGTDMRLVEHTQACAKVNVQPNQSLYQQGYDQGARQFCNYDKGFEFGKANRNVGSICARIGMSKEFNTGYVQGKQIYTLNQRLYTSTPPYLGHKHEKKHHEEKERKMDSKDKDDFMKNLSEANKKKPDFKAVLERYKAATEEKK